MLHYLVKISLNGKKQASLDFLPKKNSINSYIYFTIFEKLKSKKVDQSSDLTNICKLYKYNMFGSINYDLRRRLMINLVFKDMIHNYKLWRHIKGYPVNGQRT